MNAHTCIELLGLYSPLPCREPSPPAVAFLHPPACLPAPQAFGGLWQHGEPHNVIFSDDHASVTNEVEKLLQVAGELGGTEAVLKVVEQFGEGPGWTEMNVATAFRCLAVAAARMPAARVEEQVLSHPCFHRLVASARQLAGSMNDDELGEVARACADLRYHDSPLAAQVC